MKRGCAHVAGLYTVPNGSGAQVANGADVIWNTGLRVLKLYLTPNYAAVDYPLETWSATPTTLTTLAQTTEMATQLARAWDTVMLTCFTFANGTTNWWRADPAAAKLQAEYDELYALCVHLLSMYAGKTFVVQNWEGDWAFMDSTTVTTDVDEVMVARYAAFLGTRQRAVRDAMRDTASSSRVLHAIECNRVLDARRFAHRRRLLTHLASRLTPDLISYSAYDSTIVDQGGWGASYAAWRTATLPAFRKALQAIAAAWPGVPVYIGEFGWPEEEAPVGADLEAMTRDIDAECSAAGLKYLVYWQVFDNEVGGGGPGTYRGYWFRKPNGDESIAGAVFASLGP